MKRKCLTSVYFPSLSLSIFFIFILFHLHVMKSPRPNNSSKITTQIHHKFSLLIGILTCADNYDRRHFLRLIYGIQSSPLAKIDVKFVVCNLTKPEQRMLVALEILRYDDIIVLNCTENMNEGKTYTYFSSLPNILRNRYDYVMKADDDVFIRLEPLASSLEPLPRLDLYYGFVIPCNSKNPFVEYMSGMGFLLSWDLVEWISESSIPKLNLLGPEDRLVGKWFKIGNKAQNRFSNKPAMYDYPGTNGKCSHHLIPETIAVHRLKKWDQWFHVLDFFNVTKHNWTSLVCTIYDKAMHYWWSSTYILTNFKLTCHFYHSILIPYNNWNCLWYCCSPNSIL